MMKRILFLTLLAMPAALFSQRIGVGGTGAYTITGHLQHLDAPWIYLVHNSGGIAAVDSARASGGVYHFSGNMEEQGPVALMDIRPAATGTPLRDFTLVYLTAGNFEITHTDSFSHTVMKGPEANTEFQKLSALLQPYTVSETELMQQYGAAQQASDTEAVLSLTRQFAGLETQKKEVYHGYVKQNPLSPIVLYALNIYAGEIIDAPEVQPLYDALSSADKGSVLGKALGDRIALAARTSIGKKAIDFTQNDTLGHPVSLSSFRGRYVLVDFWASWCGPCRQENPAVAEAYRKFHGLGFDILGVSLDRPADKAGWLKAIHDDHLAWTQVSDLAFWNNAAAKAYGITSIPQNVLVDPSGTIIAKNLRGEDLQKRLREIFK